jgi:MFS family permease
MRITIGWGITSIIMMFVTTPAMFYFLRFLLGVFEAGFYPGIILYLTYWYPTVRRAKAFGMFMSASALAGVIGGPLAGAIMGNLGGVNGWSGWQWLFLLEGIPSVIAGVVTFFYLTDKPEQANWLSAEQRRLVHEDLAKDAQGLGHREHSIMAGVKDRRVWLLILIYFCLLAANSTLTFFAPSIVREVGFATPQAVGWITAIAYLFGAGGMIWNGAHSDRHQEVRYHFGLAALLGAISMTVMALLIQVSPIFTLVAMTLAIVGTMSAIPVFWQLPSRLLSGAAAAAGIALINSVANLAGAGAPYMTGLIKTATGGYSLAFFIIAAIEAVAVLLVLKFVPKLHAQPSGPVTFH